MTSIPKEYFLEGEKGKVYRKCPICNGILNYTHFRQANSNSFHAYQDAKEMINIWNDERIAIPCCRCTHIMRQFRKYRASPTLYNMDDSISVPIYINLRKFGVIE